MEGLIIIIIIVVLFYFLFWNNRTNSVIDTLHSNQQKGNSTENILRNEVEQQVFSDEIGEYKLIQIEKKVARKTYILAKLSGKYWGEYNESITELHHHSKFFNFNIYEVVLKDAEFSNSPFQLSEDISLPREIIPKSLPTILSTGVEIYNINLYEPKFSNIVFDRKLHQEDGKEVFGTIESEVSGYILDFITEYYEEKEYIKNENQENVFSYKNSTSSIFKTTSPTGNKEFSGNYKRLEYYYSDYEQTYWGSWMYEKQVRNNNEGCLSMSFGLLTILLGIIVALFILPHLFLLIPFLLLFLIIKIFPIGVFRWLFNLLSIALLILFFVGIIQFFQSGNGALSPRPLIIEKPEEKIPEFVNIIDSVNNKEVKDTLIKHFRSWQNYEGQNFEGSFWVKKSALLNAKNYKLNLSINTNSNNAYDEVIFLLKENDKNNLTGIYQLFDSLKLKNNFTDIQFAELIVSFIQDIPYSVIVPKACDPNLYDDIFIKNYLKSTNARCDGYEKFGINTPVEFMANLYGDCDTRTLLIYSLLSHYNYDVALLSSEYYSHSIIGINLPIEGLTYRYNNQKYILWETTSPGIRAGVLPKEISNLNYWRISLKSK